jgi:hypothetical protein
MDTPLMMGKGETVAGRVDLPVVCGDMDSASRKIRAQVFCWTFR